MRIRTPVEKALRAFGLVVVLASVCTALIGFAHTRAGRPLLARLTNLLGKPAGCPAGYDTSQRSDAAREAARRRFAESHAGATPAQARPALGFILDRTTRAEILSWAQANGVRCERPRSGNDLECISVPAALLPDAYQGATIQTLWVNFDGQGRLISLIAIRRERSPEVISAAYRSVNAGLAREAGPPSSQDQNGSSEFLLAGLLRQASAEYRFSDYYAQTRATNMGDGFVLTEEYRSLRDSSAS